MNSYKYDFSVITAVYNVEKFLGEAVESLINQTIGFEHIQLIMVDDGSTDNSGAICDEYEKKYPENVIVIHKENGRQASARNAGIPYAEGKYVNFMDPDDTLSNDTMELVKAFMDGEGQQADMCCIPLYFFGNIEGNHPLNPKFSKGTRLVDLLEEDEPENVIFSTASAFIRLETAKKMEFDTEMYHGEDAKEAMKILINNPKLGLVSEVRYNYRKHGSSTLDKRNQNENAYLPLVRRFYKWILARADEKYGYIPNFVQNAVMYDLKYKLKQTNIPSGVLTDEEVVEYKKELFLLFSMIDDDIILQRKELDPEMKVFLFGKKYNRSPKLKLIKSKKGKPYLSDRGSICDNVDGKTDIILSYNDINVIKVSEMPVTWQFIEVNESRQECILEGHHVIYGLEKYDVKPIVIADGKIFECETYRMEEWNTLSLGDTVSHCLGFKVTIPLKEETRIYAGLKVRDIPVINTHIDFGYFFPVSKTYSRAYAFINGYTMTVEGKCLQLSVKVGKCSRFVRECRFLTEIWKMNLLGGRKAVVGRIVYHLVKPHLKEQIWMVSDRLMKADDNGEAIFRYLQENKPEGVKVIFTIKKESKDYPRLSSIGRCVDSMSFRHKMLHLLCDVNISSGAERAIVNPFTGHSEALRDLLANHKFVFLQHGIIEKDGSDWIKKHYKSIDGFITSAEIERDSILNGKYYYDEKNVWLTGLPRYDRLYHSERKKITVIPTWRKSLVGESDPKTGIWAKLDGFNQSDYYKFYDGLLNSERLLDVLQEYGYTLQFFPHPIMRVYLDEFHQNDKVRYLSTETLYRDVYAESELIVTDYSSAVFDFAYLRKPVIYCQFDRDDFFGGSHTMKESYFDYEEDGFGEVVYDLDSVIDTIIEYVKNGCRLKDRYRSRIDSFFAYNDCNNCRRVVDHILDMCENS